MASLFDEVAKHLKESAPVSLSLPHLNQGEVDCSEQIKKMSCDEMERALYKQSRRPADRIRGQGGVPQSARALLEENKVLVEEKREHRAMMRQNSREFVEKLLADDRVVNEADKAKDIGRRTAQRGLAQYYKAKIAEKEAERSASYQTKLASGVAIQFFPFVEGETINQNRQAEAAKMREEMRDFLQKKQDANPSRVDMLKEDSGPEYQHRYPFMPVYSQSARGPAPPMEFGSSRSPVEQRGAASASATPRGGSGAEAGAAAPHLARYPKFLSKAREHMSRRIQDTHVRMALEDKVERTKAELQELTRRRQLEAQQWEDGLVVNDALRYDGSRVKNVERLKNAEFLKKQVEDRRERDRTEIRNRRAEPAGYWGPDEKALRDVDTLRDNCGDLIAQMEVNQRRKLDSRNRRLVQERVVIDNSLAEMSLDRVKEKEKLVVHKEILTTTWESQKKIRQVMDRIEGL